MNTGNRASVYAIGYPFAGISQNRMSHSVLSLQRNLGAIHPQIYYGRDAELEGNRNR